MAPPIGQALHAIRNGSNGSTPKRRPHRFGSPWPLCCKARPGSPLMSRPSSCWSPRWWLPLRPVPSFKSPSPCRQHAVAPMKNCPRCHGPKHGSSPGSASGQPTVSFGAKHSGGACTGELIYDSCQPERVPIFAWHLVFNELLTRSGKP